ncbi:hypothetical protein PAMC26510_28980 [Caballeronia sordidicola]|uniref:Uncharacterized protein n=1 Tax=Caballeronia sordidicola TaxID=196367 RepID=A0A242MB49_CABSO|nr:hypothetical protein PAMC26510_28980 [Caballeronia sordidicola]
MKVAAWNKVVNLEATGLKLGKAIFKVPRALDKLVNRERKRAADA